MRTCRVFVAMILIYGMLTATTCAADDAVAAFGKLPARFNGRVSTIEDGAKAMLLQLSGRDVYYDDAGNPHSAAEWLLGEATSDEQSVGPRIFEIRDAQILSIVGLAARTEPGPLQHRYSFSEIKPAFAALRATEDKAYSAKVTAALESLMVALGTNNYVRLSFQEPVGNEVEQIQAFVQGMQLLNNAVLPLVVPPKDTKSDWTPWGRAVVDNTIIELVKPADVAANPFVAPLRAIFAARRAGDAQGFAQAVAAYSALVKQSPFAAAGALSYELPAGWNELGVTTLNDGYYFDDTLVGGAPVAVFGAKGIEGAGLLQLIYFPSATASVERIVNHWRFQSGLAPLADDELRKTLTPIRAGDVDGVLVDLLPADNLPVSAKRVRAAVFRRANDALVFMSVGPSDAVAAEIPAADGLLKSLKLAPSEEAARVWFNVQVDPGSIPNMKGISSFVVVLKRGADVWSFRVNALQPFTDATRADCLQFVEHYPAEKLLKRDAVTNWSPPAGWKSADDVELRSFIYGEGAEARYLTAVPLQGYTAASELPLVNEFRTTFHLPAWTAAELAEKMTTIKLGDVEARTTEFSVPK